MRVIVCVCVIAHFEEMIQDPEIYIRKPKALAESEEESKKQKPLTNIEQEQEIPKDPVAHRPDTSKEGGERRRSEKSGGEERGEREKRGERVQKREEELTHKYEIGNQSCSACDVSLIAIKASITQTGRFCEDCLQKCRQTNVCENWCSELQKEDRTACVIVRV